MPTVSETSPQWNPIVLSAVAIAVAIAFGFWYQSYNSPYSQCVRAEWNEMQDVNVKLVPEGRFTESQAHQVCASRFR